MIFVEADGYEKTDIQTPETDGHSKAVRNRQTRKTRKNRQITERLQTYKDIKNEAYTQSQTETGRKR